MFEIFLGSRTQNSDFFVVTYVSGPCGTPQKQTSPKKITFKISDKNPLTYYTACGTGKKIRPKHRNIPKKYA